MAFTFTLKMV